MKIVYVITFYPFPPRGGGRLRCANLIKSLSEHHELHLVCLDDGAEAVAKESRDEGLKYAESIQGVRHKRVRMRGFVRQLMGLIPYEVGLYHNPMMKQTVRQAIQEIQPDVVLCSRLAGTQYIPHGLKQLAVLDQHDLSRYLWTTFVEGNPHWWKRWFCRFNRALVKRYEDQSYKKFDACISVSETESEMTKEFAPAGMRLVVATNGVDAHYYHPQPETKIFDRSMVLTGSMNQERNIEAAIFAAKEVLPQLQQEFPDASLMIVGQSPSPRVQVLDDLKGVTVTGEVEDVRPYIASAEAVLAPYQFGSGVKHKVPISMAMGKAIVGTSNAFQGIKVVNGTHALIGETPATIREHVGNLFRDTALRERLEKEAFELARREYTWDSIVARLNKELFTPQ